MGKTFRRNPETESSVKKKPKNHNHTNGKKLGGMKLVNGFQDWAEDDYFDDEVSIRDTIVINKFSDDKS